MVDIGKVVVIHAREGQVLSKEIVEEKLIEVLKRKAAEALEKWDPFDSNFDIIKYDYEIERKLPLKPEELDNILKLNPMRIKDTVIFSIPIFIISFKNYSTNEGTVDEEVYVVAPYIGEDYVKYVEEVAIMTTSK